MGTVSLHAISIDELRDAFSGTDVAVERLRAVALAAWPPDPAPATRRGGLLSKLGPFSRRAVGAPVVRPGVPTGRDLADVAQGREVPPERREAAWALVDTVVAATEWGRLRFDAGDRTIDDLDFTMATVGLPSRFGLRQLFSGDVAIPVKLLPGMADGYARGGQAVAMASAWGEAVGALEEEAPLARRVAAWLAGFPGWTAAANEAGRAAPDLVVWYRS